MLISEFFEHHYRIRRLRGKSQETSRLYRISVRNFEKTLGRRAVLADLTNENVSLHMQTMLDRGRAKATANKDRSQLLALWRFATRIGMHTTHPEVMPETEPIRVPVAWMADDIHKLMAAIKSTQGNIGDVPASVWWLAILSVCLDTGERIGAVAKARWSWLDGQWLLIPAEARKGSKRDKRYTISAETMGALRKLRKYTDSTAMFPWPYCHVYLWTKFDRLLKDAGLPHGRKDKFHRLRKTLGSVAYAAGLDAQDILDHQHKRTTQAYIDPRFSRDVQPSKIIADWLRKPPPPDLRRKAQ